jgi:hypothetical protein
MPHVFAPAASGRARCRGCAGPIERGALRFGERLPNPFADGETTHWYHPVCAAYKRPEPLLEALAETRELPGREALERTARAGLLHRRLPRVDGVERAPTGQAKCRQCREPIARGTWRIRLVFFEDGRFTPAGNVHLGCRGEYFEGHDVLERALHFTPELAGAEREELTRALSSS